MKNLYRLCALIGLVIAVHSGPLPRLPENNDAFAQVLREKHCSMFRLPVLFSKTAKIQINSCPQNYLKKFYNFTEQTGSASKGRGSHMSVKIAEMQEFFGLTVTGTVDKETLQVMMKPRCGVPDVAQYSTFGEGLKWQRNQLTFRWGFGQNVTENRKPKNTIESIICTTVSILFCRIVNYTPDMSVAEVDDVIARALQVWARVTPLRFTRISSGEADIMVSFGTQCKFTSKATMIFGSF